MMLKEIELSQVLLQIEEANDFEMKEIISAVIRRYSNRCPDYEAVFLTLPRKDPEERKRIFESLLHTLEPLKV